MHHEDVVPSYSVRILLFLGRRWPLPCFHGARWFQYSLGELALTFGVEKELQVRLLGARVLQFLVLETTFNLPWSFSRS